MYLFLRSLDRQMGASKPALPVTLCEKIAVTAKLNMIFVIWQILYRRGNTHLRLFLNIKNRMTSSAN